MSSALARLGPNPRFRLYTSAADYAAIAGEVLLLRTTRGDAGERLEREVSERVGAPFALCVPRARSGLFLALRALLAPGQKVVLSPYTIYEVVNAVLCAGGVPVFADIERETCNLDPASVEALLDAEPDAEPDAGGGPGVGAVLVTHLHGLAMDLERIAALCRARGVALVEDCAQAFGARRAGRSVGTTGDVGVYSFGTYKNLTSFLGGMVVTARRDLHARLANELAALPWQPLAPLLSEAGLGLATDVATWPPLFRPLTFHLFRFGALHDVAFLNERVRVEHDAHRRHGAPGSWLCRMRPLQARLALRHLERVESDTRARIAHARRYHEGLADLPELLLPPLCEDGSHTYAYYPIQLPDRDALVQHLLRRGCDLAVQHLGSCAERPCFEPFRRECPNARATAAAAVLLPTYPRYGADDVERNVRAIRDFFGRPPARGRRGP